MRFRVLALHYDGTIAEGGALVPEVKVAIQEARAQGIVADPEAVDRTPERATVPA